MKETLKNLVKEYEFDQIYRGIKFLMYIELISALMSMPLEERKKLAAELGIASK